MASAELTLALAQYIGSKDPHALKIPARRAESLYSRFAPPVLFTLGQNNITPAYREINGKSQAESQPSSLFMASIPWKATAG